jgi:hypothetical protein
MSDGPSTVLWLFNDIILLLYQQFRSFGIAVMFYFGNILHAKIGGRGSRVGIATMLRAGRFGDRMPVGVEIFPTRLNRLLGPHSFLYNGTGFLSLR